MKAKKHFHPSDLIVRCLAMKRDGYWVAMCIDLDLVVQADTVARARKLLNSQIASYVTDAMSVDSEHADVLMRRRAPLQYLALYYLAKLVHSTRRKLSFETAMPLVPAGA